MRSIKHALTGILLTLGVLALTACSDEPQAPVPTSEQSSAANSAHQVEWLELKSEISPAQWIASRREAAVRPADDPAVQRIASDLASAHAIYRESERMIANRAVQLEGMLKSLGIEQDAASILSDLLTIAGEVGQTEGFGAVTQHYYNLRSGKAGRDEALAELKERYGPRQ